VGGVKVALLGTGAMGSGMARTLARSGQTLTLWNRTSARASGLAAELHAELAPSPAEAVRRADVVISMLADREAVDEVYLSGTGVLEGARAGLIACEMSTVEPAVSRNLAARLRRHGADLVDAPVSGSVGLAEQGGLTIMVGGRGSTVDTVRPVLDVLGSRVIHMGDVGSGATMKLAVNSVLHGLNQAIAEALVLLDHAGVDLSLAYDVLEQSAAGAPFVHYQRGAYLRPDETPVAFRLALARKDVQLVLALADEAGVTMSQAMANLASLDDAVGDLGEADMAALVAHVRRQSRSRPEAAEPIEQREVMP
jgi:3-hydroxyisobutyrate dehydrogenase/2-hydroxy-3-oxopropionate reductase